jgi:hypothetical protein
MRLLFELLRRWVSNSFAFFNRIILDIFKLLALFEVQDRLFLLSIVPVCYVTGLYFTFKLHNWVIETTRIGLWGLNRLLEAVVMSRSSHIYSFIWALVGLMGRRFSLKDRIWGLEDVWKLSVKLTSVPLVPFEGLRRLDLHKIKILSLNRLGWLLIIWKLGFMAILNHQKFVISLNNGLVPYQGHNLSLRIWQLIKYRLRFLEVIVSLPHDIL